MDPLEHRPLYISHSDQDRDFGERLADALKHYKIESHLVGRQPIGESIPNTPTLWAAGRPYCVVLLWSSASLTDEALWLAALNAVKLSILVIAVTEKSMGIPAVLQRAPSVDLSDWDGGTDAKSLWTLILAISAIGGSYIERRARFKDPGQVLEIFYRGTETWNRWMYDFPGCMPDLRRADVRKLPLDWGGRPDLASANLRNANLSGVDFHGATLSGADLSDAELQGAILESANLEMARGSNAKFRDAQLSSATLLNVSLPGAEFRAASLRHAHFGSARLPLSNFTDADLTHATFWDADLTKSNLTRANLYKADLTRAKMSEALLTGTRLDRAVLRHADLTKATLDESDLSGADLTGSDLRNATLRGARLRGANLTNADLHDADLRGADLCEVNLSGATLVRTRLAGTLLTGARVYGASVWDVETDDTTQQTKLIVTADDESALLIDDVEVAQFIYLLLNRKRIQRVIDTVARKGVLLLGRFGDGGLALLEAIAAWLRRPENGGYVPLLFDFPRPESKTYTDTVRILAGLARFVVVELSGPSVPQEITAIVDQFEIPFLPIINENRKEWSMFRDFLVKQHVLDPIRFADQDRLLRTFAETVIEPAEKLVEQRQAKLDKIFGKP